MAKMWRYFCLILLVVGSAVSKQDEEFEAFQQGIEEYFNTNTVPKYFEKPAPKSLNFKHLFRESLKFDMPDDATVCKACNLIMDKVIEIVKNGTKKETMQTTLSLLCTWLKIESKKVCKGFIELNMDPIIYIINHKKDKNMKDLDGKKICAAVLQSKNCEKGENFEWTIDIPEGTTVEEKEPTKDSKKFNIVHLSDFHYDPEYTEGNNVDCEDPLCCQSDSSDPKNASFACGYWTEYKNADIPIYTIEETFRHINEKQKFDYIYFTGDIISHRVWTTSSDGNTKAIQTIYNLFRESFPNKKVFPILGNHEPSPINQWTDGIADTNVSTEWLYNLVAEEWKTWLPEDDAQSTIKKGGFYTVSPKKGFRIIVLNSNVCYNINWWLLYDDKDPYGQLKWLVDILTKSEKDKESVHILSHMPSGNSNCLRVWSREYNKIIQRFANTITGQFTGHTHKDEFQVYFNKSNPSQAVNVAHNGASLVTYMDANPSYKVIEVFDETLTISDIFEWTFNLTEANLNGKNQTPNWYQLYSFKNAYNLADMKPETIGNLLTTMTRNHALLEQFHNFRYKNSDNMQSCDTACQREVLRVVSTSLYGDNSKSNELQKLFDDSLYSSADLGRKINGLFVFSATIVMVVLNRFL